MSVSLKSLFFCLLLHFCLTPIFLFALSSPVAQHKNNFAWAGREIDQETYVYRWVGLRYTQTHTYTCLSYICAQIGVSLLKMLFLCTPV